MDNNIPSENREIDGSINLNSPPAPQQVNNCDTIEAQINQQGYQVVQGNQSQQVYISQQAYLPQQVYLPQQGYQVLQENQSQQGYLPQQGYKIQQIYGQPVLFASNSNSIMTNQSIHTVLVSTRIIFGRSPISIVCPRCKVPVTTVTEDNFNWSACCLCFFTLFVIFACIQCFRGKEIGCTDTKHLCPNCGQFIGGYVAI